MFVKSAVMSVDVSITILYGSTIGYISVDCRSSLGRYSTDISIEYRQMHARQLKKCVLPQHVYFAGCGLQIEMTCLIELKLNKLQHKV